MEKHQRVFRSLAVAFRAIGYNKEFLYENKVIKFADLDHAKLREEIVKCIAGGQSTFNTLVEERISNERLSCKDFDGYIELIKKSGVWGGKPEVVGAALLKDVCIVVLRTINNNPECETLETYNESASKGIIVIECQSEDHFIARIPHCQCLPFKNIPLRRSNSYPPNK